jgi:hypothetical protein
MKRLRFVIVYHWMMVSSGETNPIWRYGDTDNENAADNVWMLSEIAITPQTERKKRSKENKSPVYG